MALAKEPARSLKTHDFPRLPSVVCRGPFRRGLRIIEGPENAERQRGPPYITLFLLFWVFGYLLTHSWRHFAGVS